ncbi:DMT family transporter [Magnetovibrio sp.]|uniref:DMT family transporter n=1 Tax=Magnetovibrio sp. TaxID=2024836 RepID=UPI002F94FBE9
MPNNTLSLYAITVLIWGSTWYVIKLQLGVVEPQVSVVYRFALAAVLLIGWCLIKGKDMRYSARDHLWMAVQGLFLFSANYAVFYVATGMVTTGLIAVVFSTIVGWNIVLGRVFFRTPVTMQMLLGALCGICGLALVFWPEVSNLSFRDEGAYGLYLCVIATVLASLGNMASARNQKRGLPVLQVNAYGMAYGAAFTAVYAWANGMAFNWDGTVQYVASLFYLSVFGSIIAFGTYLTLLGRIGAGQAAYATVLFPVVALSLSVWLEGYVFTPTALAGAAMVLFGNILVLAKSKHFNWLKQN